MSAMDPAIKRHAPDVRPYTEEGQRYKERSSDRERAISGRPIVTTPLVKLARKPTKDGVKMVRKVCRFDALEDKLEDSESEIALP
jgi:hypothetical protein